MSWLNVLRSDIPALTHVDYSARVQTVDAARNPRYYGIIKAFEDLTGCGVIVNTSFNIRGEPFVCRPDEACRCFMFTDLDALVLENCVRLKEDWLWMGIAFVIGSVMSRMLLSLVFFLVVTPLGLAARLIGRDRLQLKKPAASSYWRDLPTNDEPARFERQF